MSTESNVQGEDRKDWGHLQERLTADAADLAHLEVLRTRLGTVMEQARQMAAAQAAQRAAKQGTSQTLKAAITEGDRLASLLRAAVKQHYGVRSEKLAEFGVQPFRGRKRTKQEAKQPQTPPPPATPSHPTSQDKPAQ
jgi:hypothetical protein